MAESHTNINSENVIMKLSLRKDTLLLVCGVIYHSKKFLKTEEKAFM